MTFAQPNIGFMFLVALFGAIMGSFFNMLIYRVPRRLSIIGPSSFCPACGKPIPWWANVPIISYLLLRGKCVHCKQSIPVRYLVVEVITSVAYALLYWRNLEAGILQWSIETLFVSLLIIVTFTDLETYLIPDVFSLGGLVAGLALSPWNRVVTVMDAFLGAFVGGGILFVIAYGYYKARGIEGMGGGDIKLLAMIGAFTGWKGALVALFISAFTGAVVGLIVFVIGKSRSACEDSASSDSQKQSALSTMIPYGPFLAFGGLLALLWGKMFWTWYLSGF